MGTVRFARLVGLGMLGVASCSDTDTPSDNLSPDGLFNILSTEFVGAEARLSARFNTAFIPPFIEGMPTTGTATYDGTMSVELDTAGDQTLLYGDAAVSADFGAGTLSGRVTDFVGRDHRGSVDTYDGSLALTDGRIAVQRPNDFRLDYGGTLTGNDSAIDLSGTIDGSFKGDPIRGLLGYDTDPLAVVNGAIVDGAVGLAVEAP